jgi:hypothetical protein
MTVQDKIKKLEIALNGGNMQNGTFFTEDGETIIDICIETNTIWTWFSFTAPCGCCSESVKDKEDLDWFIDHMSETDFNEFVEHIETINK